MVLFRLRPFRGGGLMVGGEENFMPIAIMVIYQGINGYILFYWNFN